MKEVNQKTTVYLSPVVRQALKRRVAASDDTMSRYVEQAVALAIAEDLDDLKTIDERIDGQTESLDEFVAALKRDGIIQD